MFQRHIQPPSSVSESKKSSEQHPCEQIILNDQEMWESAYNYIVARFPACGLTCQAKFIIKRLCICSRIIVCICFVGITMLSIYYIIRRFVSFYCHVCLLQNRVPWPLLLLNFYLCCTKEKLKNCTLLNCFVSVTLQWPHFTMQNMLLCSWTLMSPANNY